MWRLYIYGYWIDNWIYQITHSYTQLQCIHSYNSLQFTVTLAESSLVACIPIPPDPFACNSATLVWRLLLGPTTNSLTAAAPLEQWLANWRSSSLYIVSRSNVVAWRNTSPGVCCPAAARASAILFTSSSAILFYVTLYWLLPSCYGNRCKQTPYCLQHARHSIIDARRPDATI
jgi:uncharacterized membrane protein YwaF